MQSDSFALSQEMDILLSGVKACFEESALQEFVKRCYLPENNWRKIILEAHDHVVSTILYHGLKDVKDVAKVIPNEILENLENMCKILEFRNRLLLHELGNLIQTINDTEAQVILLKGAALAQTVYPNTTLRLFGDIDLLIKPHDWPVIREILIEMGYTPERNYDALRVDDLWEYTYSFRTINFTKNNNFPLSIDIHCNSIHIGRSRTEAPMLWDRAIEIKVDNTKGLGLCPEDLLLHLCVHLNFHNYEELRWFADIYAVVKHYSKTLDWTRLIHEVRGKGIASPLYYGLLYTKYLLDCPLPLEVLKELQPNWLSRKRFEFFWNEKKILQDKSKPHPIIGRGLIWLIVDRSQDKLRYIFRMFFPPVSWLRCHYSLPKTRKNYLFYFSHFVNILKFKL